MPPELLELSSVAVCHHFHSIDWYKYMASKLPLAADGFSMVQALKPGEALMFAAWAEFGAGVLRHDMISSDDDDDGDDDDDDEGSSAASGGGATVDHDSDSCFLLRVRPRITADRGASRHNVRV